MSSNTPQMNIHGHEQSALSPAGEVVSAALALIDNATIDGPLAVVPTASLKRLEQAINTLFRAAVPEQTDKVCSN